MNSSEHDYLLWIDGVDFPSNLYDTNDLSTTRGASLALLYMPERADELLKKAFGSGGIERIFSGASQAAFRLACDDGLEAVEKRIDDCLAPLLAEGVDPEDVRKAGKRAHVASGTWPDVAPFAHLRFVWRLAQIDDDPRGADGALYKAQGMARRRQLCESAPRRTPNGAIDAVCAIDRKRPADATIWVKADAVRGGTGAERRGRVDATHAAAYGEDEIDKGGEASRLSQSREIKVSKSVAARRHFGRWARQGFYASELGLSPEKAWGLGFADSLYDIVSDPPTNTPLALRQKLAVFYADGNKFGRIRARLAQENGRGVVGALSAFSRNLLTRQRERLLRPLIEAFRLERHGADEKRFVLINKDRPKLPGYLLRLETLLWGGDEVMFVVPAWLGWWLARSFFDWTRDWAIDGKPLTFAAGLVFTSYKTPIRDAQRIARELADMAKDAFPDGRTSALEVEALESVDPPLDDIGALRHRLLGLPAPNAGVHPLTIRAGEIEDFCTKIATFKRAEAAETTVPKSQVYRILQAVAEKSLALADDAAAETVLEEWKAYRNRTGGRPAPDTLALTCALRPTEHFALNFYLLAQQWDYVDPFGDETLEPLLVGQAVGDRRS